MSRIVDRIRAKVTRAKQHIQDFQLGLTAFYNTSPFTVAFKEDANTGKRIYYVSKAECVPDDLAAIAADVIQNLRSPLDHIAYQLVLDARGGTPPEHLVYYPITSVASEYPALRAKYMKSVRQDVIDAIDTTQPYKGGKGHTLWQLNELNKPDKHHLLIGAATISGGVDIMPTFRAEMRKAHAVDNTVPDQVKEGLLNAMASMGPVFIKETLLGPANTGDELFIEPLNLEMEKDRRFRFHVALNAPGIVEPEPALKTLQDMANLVDDIVTTLGKLLP